jgi:hypothetical protein
MAVTWAPLNFCAVLWTGEAVFTRSGVHSPRNLHGHKWSTENYLHIRNPLLQHRFGVSVWAETVDDYVIGGVKCRIVSVERSTPVSLKESFDFTGECVLSTRRCPNTFCTSKALLA